MLGSLMSKYLIQQLTSDKTPSVYEQKCMNVRQKRQQCKSCITNCPADALSFRDTIKLDAEKCINCNRCVVACPSVVFVPLMETVEPMYRKIHQQDCISIACQKSDSKVKLSVGCIAELPWEVFAYITLDKELTLDMTHCSKCEDDNARRFIQSNLQRLKVFLGDELYSDKVQLTTEQQLEDENVLTRRELFSFMLNQGKNTVNVAVPFLFPKNEDARIYRTMLKQKIHQIAKEKKQRYGWNSIAITNNCYGCKTCEKLCPQKAIQIVDEDNKRYFVHDYSKCTHCGICNTVCNQEAIQMTYVQKDGTKAITACEIEAINCRICKDPMPVSEDGLCIICRRKQNRRQR